MQNSSRRHEKIFGRGADVLGTVRDGEQAGLDDSDDQEGQDRGRANEGSRSAGAPIQPSTMPYGRSRVTGCNALRLFAGSSTIIA